MSGFKPRAAKVELYGGDWQQRIEEAAKAVDKARSNKVPLTLDEEPELDLRVREFNALVEEAIEDRVVVTLQALGRKAWADLVAANPPRTGEDVPAKLREYDAEIGVNDEALGDALVPMSIVSIDPDMTHDELLENISSAQFDMLYQRAFELNRGVGADPKAVPRLTLSPSSSETVN